MVYTWSFFALAFGFSWLFWGPAALLGQGDAVRLLHYLGGVGPLVAGIALACWSQNREICRDYWWRAVDGRRIRPGWYAVILLSVPVFKGLALLADALINGGVPSLDVLAGFAARPWALLPFAFFMFFFGPVPEELGWRGCALDRLQERYSALISSLIIGGTWALWHLPLFFIAGTYQHGLGVGTPAFWLFMVTKFPDSILMTWIYNNTRRSTLSAILFHFMTNFVGELLPLSTRADLYQAVAFAVAALAVVLIWGPARLAKPAEIAPPL